MSSTTVIKTKGLKEIEPSSTEVVKEKQSMGTNACHGILRSSQLTTTNMEISTGQVEAITIAETLMAKKIQFGVMLETLRIQQERNVLRLETILV